MKMLKQLLVIIFVGLLTVSGTALGELGPPEGVGGEQKGETLRDGSCEDLLGITGIHGGQCGDGEQHKYGRDDMLEVEGICGGGCDQNQFKYKGTK